MPEPRRLFAEFNLALCWLTRLPVGRFLPDPAPGLPQSLWAFPLVGVVVGASGALALALAQGLGLTPLIAALLAVAVQIWLTGALHEDGLADLADGLGGATGARRLEIMRDSRIGSYGALTLGLVTALRVAALAALPPAAGVIALIVTGAISRAGIVAALRWLAPARGDGLGRGAGRAGAASVAAASLLAVLPIVAASLLGGPIPLLAGICAALACAAAQTALAIKARRALGGQTGDVLGALQQVGEVAALIALAAFLVEKA